jgi:F-box-like/F-box domain
MKVKLKILKLCIQTILFFLKLFSGNQPTSKKQKISEPASCPFIFVPDNVLELIFSFLDRSTIINCSFVNIRWFDLIRNSRSILKEAAKVVQIYVYDPSSPSPFTKLPCEVLEQIFSFLDHKSLLNSALVDKRWSEVIATSSKAMKKLELKVPSMSGFPFASGELQRHYQTVSFIEADIRMTPSTVTALKKIGQHVKNIKYSDTSMASNFFDVLGCFPNVENIEIENTTFAKRPVMFDQAIFSNLKTVQARNCNNVSCKFSVEFFVSFNKSISTFQDCFVLRWSGIIIFIIITTSNNIHQFFLNRS